MVPAASEDSASEELCPKVSVLPLCHSCFSAEGGLDAEPAQQSDMVH
jgi:hypothetical protein